MNLKKIFLSLSIKHQISFVISIISILSLCLILALFSLYGNIIISIRSRARQEYFNERYKLCFDSLIDLQNFLLFQYEQLLTIFNEQLYYFSISMNDLNESFFDDKILPFKIINYNDTIENEREMTTIKEYYKLDFSRNNETCPISDYDFTKNKVFLHNHLNNIKKMKISYLGVDGEEHFIYENYIFISTICRLLFTDTKDKIKHIKEISNNSFIDYFNVKTEALLNNIIKIFDDYKNGDLELMDALYPNIFILLYRYMILERTQENLENSLYNISHYFTYIDYLNEYSFSLSSKSRFIQEYYIIRDYINMIFLKCQNFLNINTIPVFQENNTIFSEELCFSFLYKQITLLNISSDINISRDKVEQIKNSLKVGESTINDCILGEKYNIDVDENVNSFLKNKIFNKHYSLMNIRETALFKLSDNPMGERFLGVKYTYPDYSSIIDFNPTFMTLSQLNLYSFMSFYEPAQCIDVMNNFYDICQYLMVLLLIYLWILIYIYLRIRLNKLYEEVIKPINDLNDKISQLDIREENQLKYESDDSINELFKLCNELLLGKYKKKLMHQSEIEIEKMDKDNNNNLNNLKIDRKIIEEMIQNKDQYTNIQNDIFILKSSEEKSKNMKVLRERKKLNTVIDKTENNNIYNENKDLFDLNLDTKNSDSTNEKIYFTYKKMSANESSLINQYENLFQNGQSKLYKMEKDETLLEMKSSLNYKSLYEVVNFVYDYDIEYGRNLVPKKSKLLYKENLKTYNKIKKGKSRKISSAFTKEENKSNNDKASTFNEIKDETNIKIDDFDKSVADTYDNKNLLFIWYKEAKYFHNVEFLQKDHDKELKDLCKVIINNGNEKKLINKNNKKFNTSKDNNLRTLRKPPSFNNGIESMFRRNKIKP